MSVLKVVQCSWHSLRSCNVADEADDSEQLQPSHTKMTHTCNNAVEGGNRPFTKTAFFGYSSCSR